jgi:hypothetical protein
VQLCCVRCSKLAVTSLWGGAVSTWAVLIARTRILRLCAGYKHLLITRTQVNVGEKCQGPCMVELAIQLTVVFGTLQHLYLCAVCCCELLCKQC